ncbi:unnamed protein product [Arabis nemorensis]|uniref:Uncharacterized protein n=1 Tax=Arabis nemorensis TaxID=586526 RepID=A0A565ARB9_9BRAS|nr:unnamed protein product [Arabis nemorensis]
MSLTGLNAVFEASRFQWLNCDQWTLVFINSHLMQRHNTFDVPILTEGIWRVDNHYHQDFNIWQETSLTSSTRSDVDDLLYFNARIGNVFLCRRRIFSHLGVMMPLSLHASVMGLFKVR